MQQIAAKEYNIMKTTNKDLAAIQPTLESVQLSQVIEQITDLADYEIITIHNDFCEANNDSYNHINDNDSEEIDSMFDSPSEAIVATTFGDYNHRHNYFILNGYANLVSFNYTSDDNSPIDIGELAQWLINEDKLSDYDITVTTLDDMLASIEDNITDDENVLKRLFDYLNIPMYYQCFDGSDNDKVSEAMSEINDYDYNQMSDIINYLGINYQ